MAAIDKHYCLVACFCAEISQRTKGLKALLIEDVCTSID